MINNIQMDTGVSTGPLARPAKGWPRHLLHVQRLRLDLDASVSDQFRSNALDAILQNELYSISCFLSNNDSLRSLEVVCRSGFCDAIDAEEVIEYVWPISRMFAEDSISFQGLDATACSKIRVPTKASGHPKPGDLVEEFTTYSSHVDTIAKYIQALRMSNRYFERVVRSRQNVRFIAEAGGLVGPDRDFRLVTAVKSRKARIKQCKSKLELAAYASKQSGAFHRMCHDLQTEHEDESDEEGWESEI